MVCILAQQARPAPGWRDPRAWVRVAVSASVGVVAGGVASRFTFWEAATLLGWDVAALLLVSWIWWAVGPLGPDETRIHSRREDTSVHLTEVIVLASGVALLAAVGLALVRAAHTGGGTKAYLITLGIVSVALSWSLVHTVVTLRYARTFYGEPVGGIDFNEDDPPTYLDFAYLALTIGMTFQVSETDLTNKAKQGNTAIRSRTCPALVLVRCGDRGPRDQRGVQAPPLSNRVPDRAACPRWIRDPRPARQPQGNTRSNDPETAVTYGPTRPAAPFVLWAVASVKRKE